MKFLSVRIGRVSVIVIRKKFEVKLKSVCTGGSVCVWEGGGFKLLEPVGMGGEKGRKNVFLGITKCHSGEFQKLFK